MNSKIKKRFGLALSVVLLMAFSACSILGSSDSEELLISIEGQIFGAEDTINVQLTNSYSHDIYIHRQSNWSLQQKIDKDWKTIYAPIADTGPARISLFIEAGKVKVLKLPALPSSSLYEPGHSEFRYTFGLLHEPEISSPLPEEQRISSIFMISVE